MSAFLALLVFVVVLAHARAGNADDMSASNANPVRRVVTLLQNMARKVEEEGVREKDLFDKYECFCRKSGGELAKTIAESNVKVPQLQTDIEVSEQKLMGLRQDLQSHQKDRDEAKASMQAGTAQRENEHTHFLETSGEYKSFISALEQAIPAVMNGMAGIGGFLQTVAGARLRQAVASDVSMTDYDRQVVTSYLGGSSKGSLDYVPKSGEIVGILQEMKKNFEKSLGEVVSEEEGAVKVYEELMAAKTKEVKSLTEAIEDKTQRIGRLGVEIANMKNDLTESEAALIADRKFAEELGSTCDAKKAEWDVRKKLRAEELVAIHETIKFLNDDDALDLFKKSLPSPSLLQVRANYDRVRRKALAPIIRGVSRTSLQTPHGHLNLDFVALALSGKKVDFSKVMQMIDDMVKLLATEQADDDNKKEYCEKSLDTIEDRAKELSRSVENLEKSIAENDEAIAALVTEIKALSDGIAALDKSVLAATEQRKEEHKAYSELLVSDQAAKDLLSYAKNRLNKFYSPNLYKPPPKRALTEDERIFTNLGGELAPTNPPGGIAGTGISVVGSAASLAQVSQHHVSFARLDDAPPPPPETWDAYARKSQEATGVVAMIDLLIRDLDKEMTTARTEEANAQRQYEELMDDSAMKRAADMKDATGKAKFKADLEESRSQDSMSAVLKKKELMAAHSYEMQLHHECDWLQQNFDLRMEARAEEADALKQAKAVLAGADLQFMQVNTAGRTAPGRRLRNGQ